LRRERALSPLITVVTVTFNSASTVDDACRSVAIQSYRNVEHIVVDGGSTDDTLARIAGYRGARVRIISEQDSGIYNAMNKGWRLARGDVIGFLNSDDWYSSPHVMEWVSKTFEDDSIDIVYMDIDIVDRVRRDVVVRRWKAGRFSWGQVMLGWHPPHPGFFARRALFESNGGFKEELSIAADYELMLRFLRGARNGSVVYVPYTAVQMRVGGVSSAGLNSIWAGYKDCLRAWQMNGWSTGIGIVAATLKPVRKLLQ
jgi:glycosyltransferase involved in cell wall biosynthesis